MFLLSNVFRFKWSNCWRLIQKCILWKLKTLLIMLQSELKCRHQSNWSYVCVYKDYHSPYFFEKKKDLELLFVWEFTSFVLFLVLENKKCLRKNNYIDLLLRRKRLLNYFSTSLDKIIELTSIYYICFC